MTAKKRTTGAQKKNRRPASDRNAGPMPGPQPPRQERLCRALLEVQRIAHIGSWDYDPVNDELWWSDEVYRLFGYDPSQDIITFEKFISRVHPDDCPQLLESIRQRRPFRHDYRVILPEGTERIIHEEVGMDFDAAGNAVSIFGTAQDITKRKRTEDALSAAVSRFDVLLDNLLDGVLFEDEDRQVLFVNRRFCELFSIPGQPKALIGSDCRAAARASCFLFAQPESFLKGIEGLIGLGEPVSGEELYLADGRVMERDYAPIVVGGQRLGNLWKYRDITGRRRMEQELLKLQKLESVGLLAGGIAHDFNNLLTAILGNIELSRIYLQPDDSAYGLLGAAEDACSQAKDLSYRLLTFAKGGEPLKRPLAAADLLRDAVSLSLSGSNVSAVFDLPETLPHVEADEGQMKQVIINLVTNAKEAMPGGGTLTVAVARVELTDTESVPLKAGPYLEICITDEGAGIPPANLEKIFDPYFTTKEFGGQRGRGLGLAICHSIVRKHGGTITVESRAGKGTSFHVFLPAVSAERSSSFARLRETAGPRRTRGRVLIMDDEERVRGIVKDLLEHLGYEAECAREGEEAVTLHRRAREQGSPFALVLLDLTVPGGMGGMDTLKKLRETDPKVRAVVSSGYADDPVLKDHRSYGFDGAIAKPYTIRQLDETLRNIIGQPE